MSTANRDVAGAAHIALVLCGGGAKGAMEIGLYRALWELGVPIHRVLGSSVGAINGAFIAAGVPPRRLEAAWAVLRRRDVLAVRWGLLWQGLRAESLYSNRRLRSLLQTNLEARTFEELNLPLTVVATDLDAAAPVTIESGPLVDALLASAAVPGIFPPVVLADGRRCIDGSLTNNVPVDLAYSRGATTVFSILCRSCDACRPKRRGLPAILGQAFGIAVDCKFRLEVAQLKERGDLCFLEPDLGLDVASLDFAHGRSLVRRTYERVKPRLIEWLKEHPEVPSRVSGDRRAGPAPAVQEEIRSGGRTLQGRGT